MDKAIYAWESAGAAQSWKEACAFVLPFAARSVVWGAAAGLLALATLFSLSPDAPFFVEPAWAVALMPCLFPLMVLPLVLVPQRVSVSLSEKGVRIDPNRRVAWRDTVAHGVREAMPDELVLVEKSGRATRLPLPDDSLRREVLCYIVSRTPEISQRELERFVAPITLTYADAISITLAAYLNGLVAAYAAVATHGYGGTSGFLAICLLSLTCVPSGLFAVSRIAREPERRFLQVPILYIVTLLAAAYAMISAIALMPAAPSA